MRIWEWYRRHQNTAIFLAFVSLAMGLFLTYEQGDDTSDRVTRIEDAPCTVDPAGRECQRAKIRSDRHRSIRSACVITRKAGLGCPALVRKEGSDEPSSNQPSRTDSGGGRPPSPPVDVDADGNGGGGGSVPVGDPPPSGSPEPPADPPTPNPPPPEPPKPPPPPPKSVGGLGVDVPALDECGLAPILCD